VRRCPLSACLAALAAPIVACAAPAAPGDTGVVVHVTDGDTIVVALGGREERVRLLGIDTPEVHTADGTPECYGPEASAFTASLLPLGTVVRLERDVVGRDDYGRLLAYVYAGDQLVNEVLVAHGVATPLSIEPNTTFARRFAAAARHAEAADLGLWGACAG
jgi:micrococcal nuclease